MSCCDSTPVNMINSVTLSIGYYLCISTSELRQDWVTEACQLSAFFFRMIHLMMIEYRYICILYSTSTLVGRAEKLQMF